MATTEPSTRANSITAPGRAVERPRELEHGGAHDVRGRAAPARVHRAHPAGRDTRSGVIPLLLALLGQTPTAAAATYDPKLHWQSVDTEHFTITFHDGEEGLRLGQAAPHEATAAWILEERRGRSHPDAPSAPVDQLPELLARLEVRHPLRGDHDALSRLRVPPRPARPAPDAEAAEAHEDLMSVADAVNYVAAKLGVR